jgi:hypothetical protein
MKLTIRTIMCNETNTLKCDGSAKIINKIGAQFKIRVPNELIV